MTRKRRSQGSTIGDAVKDEYTLYPGRLENDAWESQERERMRMVAREAGRGH